MFSGISFTLLSMREQGLEDRGKTKSRKNEKSREEQACSNGYWRWVVDKPEESVVLTDIRNCSIQFIPYDERYSCKLPHKVTMRTHVRSSLLCQRGRWTFCATNKHIDRAEASRVFVTSLPSRDSLTKGECNLIIDLLLQRNARENYSTEISQTAKYIYVSRPARHVWNTIKTRNSQSFIETLGCRNNHEN